jgi:hypothetical protein
VTKNGRQHQPEALCNVNFEFSDQRAFEKQASGAQAGREWSMKMRITPPPGIRDTKTEWKHRNESNRRIGILELLWRGDSELLTSNYALEFATVSVMGIIRDQGYQDLSFNAVLLGLREVGEPFAHPHNMTIEARVIEAKLQQFDNISMTDFGI